MKIKFISCLLIIFFIPIAVHANTNQNDNFFEINKQYSTGWVYDSGNTYYYDENFKILKGIQKIGEYYYFFWENTGKLFRSPVTMINGDLLFPNQDGILEADVKK